MISSLTSNNQQFVDNLNRIAQQLNNDQLDISSGVRIRQVSDDPDHISELLQARASFAASQQISSNLTQVKTEVDTGEQTLESAVQLFDQVQTLGAEGATGTQTASTRATIAGQLQGILQQMVGFANTSINGRFIFSGDSDQTAPYTYDSTQPNPVSAYQGSASTRQIQDPSGGTFSVALTAQQVFDASDPSTNVFSSIDGLITALNNNDQAAIQTSVDGLSGVGKYLNDQLAFYGTAQDNVSAATNTAQNQQTELQAQISGIEDTDVTSTILDMTQTQTQEQAALAAEGQIPRNTLFDFLVG
ncbi:MAG: flagellin [Bryobacteraceae bacterium]